MEREFEEEKVDIINDLEPMFQDEMEDLSVFPEINTELKVDKLIDDTPRMLDIEPNLGVLSLYEKQSLKLQKTKKSKVFFDALQSQKSKDVLVNEYKPKDDYYTVNSLDIKNTKSRLVWEVFDIWVTDKSLEDRVKIKTKKFFNSLTSRYSYIKKTFLWMFLILVMLFSLDMYKTEVVSSLESGFYALEKIKNTRDLDTARKLVNDAKRDFVKSWYLIKPLEIAFSNPIVNVEKIELLTRINEGWKNVVSALDTAFFVKEQYEHILKKKSPEDVYFSELLLNTKPYLDKIESELESANVNFEAASKLFENNSEVANPELIAKFEMARNKLSEISYYYSNTYKEFDNYLSLLGHDKTKKYLVVFQNNDEIRPTWGFMWSMAMVKIFKGQIQDIDKKDVYAYEFLMKPFTELAPEGINKLTPTFWLRDANYYADFGESSNQIKKFMDKIWETVDWVLYVNMNALEPFLDYLNGVYVPEINTTFTKENFRHEMSMLVESKLFQTHTTSSPKEILFMFMDNFAKDLKSKADYSEYTKIIKQLIDSREVYFYSFNELENTSLEPFQNTYYFTNTDFFFPYYTSLSGNKSDRYMERLYDVTVEKASECSFKNTTTFYQNHAFFATEKDNITKLFNKYDIPREKRNHLMYIAWNGGNRQYVRVKIPKDSTVLSGQTSVLLDEYREVSFYLNTDVWKSSSETIVYEIKNEDCKPYNYRFIKQPWIKWYNIKYVFWELYSTWNYNYDFKIEL